MRQTWKHGASAYRRGLCRCDICREHNTRQCLEARTRRHARRPKTDLKHGSASTYNNWGCRCDPCSIAHSQRCADYKQRRALSKTRQATPARQPNR